MADAHTINPTTERPHAGMNGGLALLAAPVVLALGIWMFVLAKQGGGVPFALSGVGLISLALLVSCGFYSLQPNEAYAITLFGSYVGTDWKTGLRWILPWYGRKKISLRVRNVTSEMLKVNDKRGNPIEIAANIVWRVQDSA